MRAKSRFTIILITIIFSGSFASPLVKAEVDPATTLWFEQPARNWQTGSAPDRQRPASGP
jgi:hypothetical protein